MIELLDIKYYLQCNRISGCCFRQEKIIWPEAIKYKQNFTPVDFIWTLNLKYKIIFIWKEMFTCSVWFLSRVTIPFLTQLLVSQLYNFSYIHSCDILTELFILHFSFQYLERFKYNFIRVLLYNEWKDIHYFVKINK